MAWKGPTKDIDRCTAPVRWDGSTGKLQQRWIITTTTDGDGSIGLVMGEREEWRDVPIVPQQSIKQEPK